MALGPSGGRPPLGVAFLGNGGGVTKLGLVTLGGLVTVAAGLVTGFGNAVGIMGLRGLGGGGARPRVSARGLPRLGLGRMGQA
jgi:hypothetical protein